jgi:integrase
MEALTAYAKYAGCYEQWQQIRKRYSLRWTNGNESIAAMQRFFDDTRSLDSMLQRVREMVQVLPVPMAAIIRFACITGLRPNEACESVRLLISGNYHASYYNSQQQCLEHWRYPEIFLRPTKNAYISYLSTDCYQWITKIQGKPPTLAAISSVCKRRKIPCNFNLCRKIFASWLYKSGIPDMTIDMLQGRVSQSVLAQHYIRPDSTLRQRVLDAVSQLEKEIK